MTVRLCTICSINWSLFYVLTTPHRAGGGRQLGVGGDLHPRPVLGLPLGVPAPGAPAHHNHGQYKHFMNINNIS